MNTLSIKTFDTLITRGIIPKGNYTITESLLTEFINTYSDLGTKGTKYNRKFARKLAGLSFLKHKLSLGYKYNTISEGIVYFIENPAWPNFLKVGITVDLDKRLQTYQTYSPFRDFKVKHYEFVLDRRLAEKSLLNSGLVESRKGEWVRLQDWSSLLDLVRSINNPEVAQLPER